MFHPFRAAHHMQSASSSSTPSNSTIRIDFYLVSSRSTNRLKRRKKKKTRSEAFQFRVVDNDFGVYSFMNGGVALICCAVYAALIEEWRWEICIANFKTACIHILHSAFLFSSPIRSPASSINNNNFINDRLDWKHTPLTAHSNHCTDGRSKSSDDWTPWRCWLSHNYERHDSIWELHS